MVWRASWTVRYGEHCEKTTTKLFIYLFEKLAQASHISRLTHQERLSSDPSSNCLHTDPIKWPVASWCRVSSPYEALSLSPSAATSPGQCVSTLRSMSCTVSLYSKRCVLFGSGPASCETRLVTHSKSGNRKQCTVSRWGTWDSERLPDEQGLGEVDCRRQSYLRLCRYKQKQRANLVRGYRGCQHVPNRVTWVTAWLALILKHYISHCLSRRSDETYYLTSAVHETRTYRNLNTTRTRTQLYSTHFTPHPVPTWERD